MNNEGKGVSNCYVFKSRLQEYAQKVGFSTPVYETIKEGPSHEPFFRSTVIVNNERYDSLPGFSNRKAAEQSAAEVSLVELAKSGDKKDCISQPVHELGLCKNLLQEYAQKMNYAMPSYECKREDTAGRGHFSCTVEIGGIRYIGAVARTKKEAEIKAARTALLAIQTSSSEMAENPNEDTKYTVVPCKRKEPESVTPKQDAVKTRKPKKGRFKKKFINKKRRQASDDNAIQAENGGAMKTNVGTEALAVPSGNGSLDVPISRCQLLSTDGMTPQDGTLNMNQSHGETSASDGLLISDVKMSECEPITMNDTTTQDETLNGNHSHGGASAGHQFGEGNAIQAGDVGAMSANLGTQVTTVPSGDGSLNGIIPQCQPVSMDDMKPRDGTPIVNQSHGDTSASEGLLIPNVEISDRQPISMNVTVQDEISNTKQSQGDASDSEALVVSLSANSGSIQKSDVVNLPAVGCTVQPSDHGQSNNSDTKQCEGSGGPGDSSLSVVNQEDSSTLASNVCSLEEKNNTCVEHEGLLMNVSATSTPNQTVSIQKEPAAPVSSMDDRGGNTLETNEA